MERCRFGEMRTERFKPNKKEKKLMFTLEIFAWQGDPHLRRSLYATPCLVPVGRVIVGNKNGVGHSSLKLFSR